MIEIVGFDPELDSFLDQLTPKSLSLCVLPRVRALTLDPGTQNNGQRSSVSKVFFFREVETPWEVIEIVVLVCVLNLNHS